MRTPRSLCFLPNTVTRAYGRSESYGWTTPALAATRFHSAAATKSYGHRREIGQFHAPDTTSDVASPALTLLGKEACGTP